MVTGMHFPETDMVRIQKQEIGALYGPGFESPEILG